MTWQHNQTPLPLLQDLSALTARLLRLVAFQQLSRGQAQLKAAGLDAKIADTYKGYVVREKRRLPAQSTKEDLTLLEIDTTARSTF